MAPLPIIENVIRVAFNWRHVTGQTAVNVMHFAGAPEDVLETRDAIRSSVSVGMWASVVDAAVIESLALTPLDGATSTTFYGTTEGEQAGGFQGRDPGESEPAVAAMVKFNTGLRGREFRGRVFLPFTNEEECANGFLSTSAVEIAQAEWNTFIETIDGEGHPLVVASYKLEEAHIVGTCIVERALGTQRRRQGRNR